MRNPEVVYAGSNPLHGSTAGAFEKESIRALRGVRYPFVNSLRAGSRAFVNTHSDRLEHALNARSRDCEPLDLRGNHFVYMQQSGGFYRAMHFSAKRGIAIACRLSLRPSVCLSVCNVGEL